MQITYIAMISNGIKAVLKWASEKEKPRMQEIHCWILLKCYRGKNINAPHNYCLKYDQKKCKLSPQKQYYPNTKIG